MKTQEILSITALSALGLCLLCGLAKMVMKSNEAKENCDKACGMLVFVAVALIGVRQLLTEEESYKKNKNNKIYCDTIEGAADECMSRHGKPEEVCSDIYDCQRNKPDDGYEECVNCPGQGKSIFCYDGKNGCP